MDNITQSSYNKEIQSLAYDIANELLEEYGDRTEAEDNAYDRIHEVIDGHQWIIYYAYNDDVLKFSPNNEAYKDVYDNESLGAIVSEQGVDSLGTMMAYFAMAQDVSEAMEAAFDWALQPNEGE